MVILLIVVTVALGYLTSQLSPFGRHLERQSEASSRLTAGKEALLGYMVASNPEGRLPLPDIGAWTTPHNEGDAPSNPTGNSKEAVLIGRLPWRTLGIGPVRDEGGDCLWYAVAGRWKNSPSVNDPFNWDSLGDLELFVADGLGNTMPHSANPHLNRPVAVILSPGPPLDGQDRTKTTTTGENVGECGGNYNASNFLDGTTALSVLDGRANPLLSGAAPGGRESDYSSDANHALGTIATFDKPKSIIASPVKIPDQGALRVLSNDRILPITADDVFQRVRALESFQDMINGEVIQKLRLCLETNGVPGLFAGLNAAGSPGRKVGKISAAEIIALCASLDTPEIKRWIDNFWYVACDTDDCIKPCSADTNVPPACPTPTPGAAPCDGALIFGGARTATQIRRNDNEKKLAASYLEGDTLTLGQGTTNTLPITPRSGEFPQCDNRFGESECTMRLSDGVDFPDSPMFNYTADTARCLNRPPPPPPPPTIPPVQFDTMIDVKPANLVAKTTDTLILGNPALAPTASSQLAACTWSPDSLTPTDDSFGNGRRIYFELTIVQRGDGFVFALIDADRNDTGVCGGADANGQYLGYAGQNIAGTPPTLVTPPIKHPKIGLEFDTEKNDTTSAGLPNRSNFRDDNNGNHVAMVYWGYSHDLPPPYTDPYEDDNIHGYPKLAPTQSGYIDPRSSNASLQKPVPTLRSAVGSPHYVRFDLVRDYVAGAGIYRSRVWVSKTKETGMDDLNVDYSPAALPPTLDETVTIQDIFGGSESFKRVRFGFTVSQSRTGTAKRQQIEIKNLTLAPR